MYKSASIFFRIIGLLLASYNPELTPASEDIVESVVGKRKRIELKDREKEAEYKRNKIDTENDSSLIIVEGNAEKQTQELTEGHKPMVQVTNLPDEVMLYIFSQLPVIDIAASASGVCHHWYVLSEEPALWGTLRLHTQGD